MHGSRRGRHDNSLFGWFNSLCKQGEKKSSYDGLTSADEKDQGREPDQSGGKDVIIVAYDMSKKGGIIICMGPQTNGYDP